jgi:hypothetical protein
MRAMTNAVIDNFVTLSMFPILQFALLVLSLLNLL